jgi:hypothetical protein
MVRYALRSVIAVALITIGCLAAAGAAPIAPTVMTALAGPPAKFVSFWGRAFPSGYAYFPGQCYMYVPVDTPNGPVWRRIWICTESVGRGYGVRF